MPLSEEPMIKDKGFRLEDIKEIERQIENKIQAFQTKMREID